MKNIRDRQSFAKLDSRNVELALSLYLVKESSGSNTRAVSEGREHGENNRLEGCLLSDCVLLKYMAAETKTTCGRLEGFLDLILFQNLMGK